MNDKPSMSDGGLGAWIRANIPDPRFRYPLLLSLGVILVANLAIRYFGGIGAAIEAASFEILLFYVSLLMITASIMSFPVGDQGTPTKVAAARAAQRNARGNFFLLVGFVVGVLVITDMMVLPVWSASLFYIEYERYKLGLISLGSLFDDGFKGTMDGNELFQDLDETQIPLKSDVVTDSWQFIKLIGSRPYYHLSADLDLRNARHTALIAARRVVFDEGTSIKLGSTNLFIIADHLEFRGLDGKHPKIIAFSDTDSSPASDLPPGVNGIDGKAAGSVTIVVLDEVKGPLDIDLRGQPGGRGAKGLQPSPRKAAPNLGYLPGRPYWSFRKPNAHEIEKYKEELALILSGQQDPKLPEESKKLLQKNDAVFRQCEQMPDSCVRQSCDDAEWNADAKGPNGQDGADGGPGGKGGKAGIPGRLQVYYRGGIKGILDPLLESIRWIDGAKITSAPPHRLRSQGGTGGDPGLGGAGGQGRPADPFGACSTGQTGQPGSPGQPGPSGDPGDEDQPGMPVQPTELLGLPPT